MALFSVVLAQTNNVATLSGLETVFGNVVGVIMALAAIVLFIMLLMGGFKYLTSGGDPKAVEAARKTLTYAIGGLVLIALSYLLLKFIYIFTGANVLEFRVTTTY